MTADLARFIDAQRGVIDPARAELRAGRKTSHWMWFVFPQVAGLGHSAMARAFAITSIEEARAYLAHPVLGPRLRESAAALLALTGATAESVLGGIDAVKLRSSMTLFAHAAPEEALFAEVIDRFFGGEEDGATGERL